MLLAGILIYAATIASFVWYARKLWCESNAAKGELSKHYAELRHKQQVSVNVWPKGGLLGDPPISNSKHPAMTAPITRKCDNIAVDLVVLPPL
jgi:hypothetical protein